MPSKLKAQCEKMRGETGLQHILKLEFVLRLVTFCLQTDRCQLSRCALLYSRFLIVLAS